MHGTTQPKYTCINIAERERHVSNLEYIVEMVNVAYNS